MAKTITDFGTWFEENELNTPDEIYTLYRGIIHGASYGHWDITTDAKGKTFVKGSDSTLMLAHSAARKLFIKRLRTFTDSPDLDIEAWYLTKTGS